MPPGATECDWSATSLESGRVGSQHERSDAQSFFEHVESLRKAGRGYAEVGHSGRPFPWLAVSFRDNNGVVHQFTSPGHCLILCGDGSVDSDTVVEVPIYDEDHSFTGDYVSMATVPGKSSSGSSLARSPGFSVNGPRPRPPSTERPHVPRAARPCR